MISSRNQNQFPSSFAPLGELLKGLMFLSNLNGFNSSPSPPNQGFAKWIGSFKVWKEKGSKWFSHFFSPLPFLFLSLYYLCVFLSCLSQSSLFFALFNMFLFSYFQFFFFSKYFFFEKTEKYKNNMCLYTLVLVYLEWLLKQSIINFVSFLA